MGFSVVGDLITHAGFQNELPSVLKLSMQFAFEAQQDVAFFTPVVGEITRRVLNHANAN